MTSQLCLENLVQDVPAFVGPHPGFWLLPFSPSFAHCPLSLTYLKSSENPLQETVKAKCQGSLFSTPMVGGLRKALDCWGTRSSLTQQVPTRALRAGTGTDGVALGWGQGADAAPPPPSLSCLVISSLSPCRPSPPPPRPPFCHLSEAPLGQQPNPKLQRELRREGPPQLSLLWGQAGGCGLWGGREGGNLAGEAGDGGVRVYKSRPTALLFNTHVSDELSVKPLIN